MCLPLRVPLIGAARDPEDGALGGNRLAWYSTVSGFLGYGPVLTFPGSVAPMLPFTPGVHIVELRATDTAGAISSDFVTITRH